LDCRDEQDHAGKTTSEIPGTGMIATWNTPLLFRE
jgi:hypothetical protein